MPPSPLKIQHIQDPSAVLPMEDDHCPSGASWWSNMDKHRTTNFLQRGVSWTDVIIHVHPRFLFTLSKTFNTSFHEVQRVQPLCSAELCRDIWQRGLKSTHFVWGPNTRTEASLVVSTSCKISHIKIYRVSTQLELCAQEAPQYSTRGYTGKFLLPLLGFAIAHSGKSKSSKE